MSRFKSKAYTGNETETKKKFNPTKKFIINSRNILIKCDTWKHLKVTSGEDWCGWGSWFKDAETCKDVVNGFNDKNQSFTLIKDGEEIVLCNGQSVYTLPSITMAVVQRNIPGTSTFDLVWCVHALEKVFVSVFSKKEFEKVYNIAYNVCKHVYDVGPDPFNWNQFIRIQKDQKGTEEDWTAVFEPFTDSEDSDSEWVGSSESESEDEPPPKRTKR